VVLFLLFAFGLIVALEVPGMMVRSQTGELRTFWVLLAIGFYMSLATTQGWPVPNPTPVLEAAFRPLSAWLGLK
jgi:hypothetical protein